MTDASSTLSREHEKHLIARLRAGDSDAMRELIEAHKDRLFAFVWRMNRHHHDAEEICQEAFLRAFKSLESFSVDYRFSTWLFTIGYRICLNRMRRKKALTGDVDFSGLALTAQDPPDRAAESEEVSRLKAEIWDAVDRLTPPQRASILLFYRNDMSCQDIGRVLELPVATVKSHLHRARNRLRETLEAMSERDLSELRNLGGLAG